jgi:very-short-patch-repair endonuclease
MGHRFHCTALDLQRDAQRRNELQAMGLVVLEFTTGDIVREPGRTLATLRRHLNSPPV